MPDPTKRGCSYAALTGFAMKRIRVKDLYWYLPSPPIFIPRVISPPIRETRYDYFIS
jgi:hypothetical protein